MGNNISEVHQEPLIPKAVLVLVLEQQLQTFLDEMRCILPRFLVAQHLNDKVEEPASHLLPLVAPCQTQEDHLLGEEHCMLEDVMTVVKINQALALLCKARAE